MDPASASRRRASKAGRSPRSSPTKHTASSPGASSATTVPLSASTGGRSSTDRRPGMDGQAGRGRGPFGPRLRPSRPFAARSGCAARPTGPCARRARRRVPLRRPRSPPARRPSATGPPRGAPRPPRPGSARGRRARPGSSPDPSPAARPGRPPAGPRSPRPGRSVAASRASIAPAPGSGAAAAGSSTMGARVPSKSLNTPARCGRRRHGRQPVIAGNPLVSALGHGRAVSA